jgi:hypothetical protein
MGMKVSIEVMSKATVYFAVVLATACALTPFIKFLCLPAGGLGYIACFVVIYLVNNYMVGVVAVYAMGTKKLGAVIIALLFMVQILTILVV